MIELWNSDGFRKRNVEYVQIDRSKILALALELAGKEMLIPDWQMPEILPSNPRAFVSYLPYICAVNFCFTDLKKPHRRFKVVDGSGEYLGSQAMSRCFYRHFGENPIEAESIKNIACSEWLSRRFFAGETKMPMLAQRRSYMLEVAHVMESCFDDNPMNIFEQANFQTFENDFSLGAIELIELRFQKSFGMDCSYHIDDLGQHWPLRFSKRAQLWLMIYQGRALQENSKLPALNRDFQLGPIADSAIPNALRDYGILKYADGLSNKINSQTELGEHSPEVIEIRLATIVAVQQILNAVNERQHALGKGMTSFLALDNILWRIGRTMSKPAHLSRTTDY